MHGPWAFFGRQGINQRTIYRRYDFYGGSYPPKSLFNACEIYFGTVVWILIDFWEGRFLKFKTNISIALKRFYTLEHYWMCSPSINHHFSFVRRKIEILKKKKEREKEEEKKKFYSTIPCNRRLNGAR